MIKFVLNCWKPLKIIKPQYKDEICLSMTATKVERIDDMAYGVNLSALTMGNQQLRPE